ncbi:hypothetical protein AAFF_G00268180 [Aldrovandia affinis]|uniref:UDP-glucuronosyltransferase n=1 Tax=Aldrovandia affinis TaxID=143900 RepID=A0AAD7WTK0_9TELE|nr:hypothetical protein AAFF_G00268180 [Aldrovandia affinis]
MKVLIEGMHSRGHTVTVIRWNTSWYITEKSPYYTSITLPDTSGTDEEFFVRFLNGIIEVQRGERSLMTFFRLQREFFSMISEAHAAACMMVSYILESKDLTKRLQDAQYDMVLTDPAIAGNNTLLVKWMPQNDLLGHPKTRAFVAHGGTNGVQEAIYHGMPVLGIPLFFDQYDNLLRLANKGGAKILDIITINRDIFLQALQEVLHEPSYRMNMQRLSRLHLDQPMKPLDHAIFWIEFVMRHKGAAHLRTESYRMPWYTYHSVDVIAVLLAAVFLMLLTTVAVIRFLCCRVCFKRKIKHE